MINIKNYFQENVENLHQILKYVGPGFIVTVGFIDPGNWATNLNAGSEFGYSLLWVVTLSTLILILLQYNASKLGIVSGLCIAEATTQKFSPLKSKFILYSGLLAVISTILAEILGGAIALEMIFGFPIKLGAIIMTITALFLVFSNSYHKIEGIIIGFVSLIAFCFLLELTIAPVNWNQTFYNSIVPNFNSSQIYITMGIIGAVVMPHNLFLHSEFIQSRKFKDNSDEKIKLQLKLSKTDTLISMIVGWAINSAMIILAASTFYVAGTIVTDLTQAQQLLTPLLGQTSAGIFALALLFSGLASSITAAMSGGVISAGLFKEQYNTNDRHTTIGIITTTLIATFLITLINDPFQGLILSQVILSVQLPITIITLIILTNDPQIMRNFVNSKKEKFLLYISAFIIVLLNIILFISTINMIIN